MSHPFWVEAFFSCVLGILSIGDEMNNLINHDLAHQYLIAEFTLRTLERDLKHLNDLKTAEVIEKLYEDVLTEVRADLVAIKAQMKREGLRFVGERKISEVFIGFEFNQKGISDELRYANYALRNHTLQAIKNKLG